MSVDIKYGRYCDECGRTIKKAHRVFESSDYCASCYPRVFVSKPCMNCGQSARVHRLSSDPPVCRSCVRVGRVCVRCEKPIIKAGMISAGKPVCPSCVPHFKAAMPCAACGLPKTRLSAMPSVGIYEKVCDSCRTKVTHKTCSICRKHRKVAGMTNDGKPYCQACIPGGSKSHACPDCGIDVPGTGASRCRGCLNLSKLSKEVDLNELLFARDWAKMLYRQFARWLFERQAENPSLMKVFQYHQIFFERIDAQFVVLEDLTAPVLLKTFGAFGLRKHLLPMQFLAGALSLEIDAKDKAEAADLERIRNKLLENRNYSWGKVLEQFSRWLEESGVPTRTRRLYLRTAEVFCKYVKLADQPWSDADIHKFLRNKPGLRANLFKFVGYCGRAHGWDVRMPSRTAISVKAAGVPKTVASLQKLLQKVTDQGLDQVDEETLARIIAKSMGFPIKTISDLPLTHFRSGGHGLVMEVNGEFVAVPAELEDIIRTFISRRRSQ